MGTYALLVTLWQQKIGESSRISERTKTLPFLENPLTFCRITRHDNICTHIRNVIEIEHGMRPPQPILTNPIAGKRTLSLDMNLRRVSKGSFRLAICSKGEAKRHHQLEPCTFLLLKVYDFYTVDRMCTLSNGFREAVDT
jgi:hypothetical protein